MKRQIKRLSALLLALLLLAGLFSGCGGSGPTAPAGETKLRVVTTIFPVYDWLRQILGDRTDSVELTMLLDTGVDLHSYQPTADDILKVGSCDLFVYVGGESDKWVDAALAEASNPDMTALDLMELLGSAVKEEEVVEGMEAEDEEAEEEEGPEYDEHIWLSVKNAAVICGELEKTLCRLDPEDAAAFTANAEAYIARLRDLDERYAAAVEAAPVKTVLFGDRFPFRYLADDYGLDYYAAFTGCSAESEASFETVLFLAGKVDELGLRSILQIESADGRLSATVRDATRTKDQQILTLNSLQSVTAREVETGVTYLEIMEQNLTVLEQALQK